MVTAINATPEIHKVVMRDFIPMILMRLAKTRYTIHFLQEDRRRLLNRSVSSVMTFLLMKNLVVFVQVALKLYL